MTMRTSIEYNSNKIPAATKTKPRTRIIVVKMLTVGLSANKYRETTNNNPIIARIPDNLYAILWLITMSPFTFVFLTVAAIEFIRDITAHHRVIQPVSTTEIIAVKTVLC